MTKVLQRETGAENMSQRELARYLKVSEPTLRRKLTQADCDLPHRRFGSRYVFSKAAVDAWLARQDESVGQR